MTPSDDIAWWQDAVVYQVYPRSFADGNGDGMGDLPGVIARLPYLASLGVDAVWLSPFYVSPQHDAGYDVADYRDVDPMFGTLDDAERLIGEAHGHGLKVIVDLVPNHTSSEHPWFREALAAPPDSPARRRYLFRDGRGASGEEPPNNWTSVFGGPAWTRVTETDGTPGQWYLHLFDVTQPDLDWTDPEVHAEFADVLRFWLERGVDGFRVDVAHGLVKAEGLPDHAGRVLMIGGEEHVGHAPMDRTPYFDQDGVHAIYRTWRRLLDAYAPPRILVAEAWVDPMHRLFRYVRPDEMHQAFNFDFLMAGYDPAALRRSIGETFAHAREVGAPPTWVLSNHDTVRHASRFGLPTPPPHQRGIGPLDPQPDAALGRRRARAMAFVLLGLPGSAYVYQGDELALPDHTTLPPEAREDPAFERSGGADLGRDGARVPMPWSAVEPHLGFGTAPDSAPWLPVPEAYAASAVDLQEADAESVLHLYRRLLAARKELRLGRGEFSWYDAAESAVEETAWPGEERAPSRVPDQVLAFSVQCTGGDVVEVRANLGGEEVPMTVPPAWRLVLGSSPEAWSGEVLAPDTAVWFVHPAPGTGPDKA